MWLHVSQREAPRLTNPPTTDHRSFEQRLGDQTIKLSGKSPEFQESPILSARGELWRLYYEGQAILNSMEVPGVTPPRFQDVSEWNARAEACARRKVFSTLLKVSDYAEFERDCRMDDEHHRALARIVDSGLLADGSTELVIYGYLWCRVHRLRALLNKIDSA